VKLERIIDTVEMHTGGEPFRIVTSGLPTLPGETIVRKRAFVEANLDHIRRALIFEPRGHADMYAGYLTEPVTPGADMGVIFVHNEGYSDHCGHGVIALATAAVELGWVERQAPETRVGIDAPCGFIEAFVAWDGVRAGSVRFVNVPSFVWARDVSVETDSFGRVTGDIAFGGAFYFYVDGRPHGLAIRSHDAERLIRFGAEVKAAANIAFPVVHPDIPELNHIYGTIAPGQLLHLRRPAGGPLAHRLRHGGARRAALRQGQAQDRRELRQRVADRHDDGRTRAARGAAGALRGGDPGGVRQRPSCRKGELDAGCG
jgi:trans-L-3-hydroxyproline dehydratase